MSSPWLKFYPSDWRADPALRMCSIGARGLWMEMLCLMHEAEPYGSLRINGKEVSQKQIAALAGAAFDDVTVWLSELEDAGVFSRDESGVIISRRMMRDKAKAEADQKNGKRGGNPGLTGGVNPPVKGKDKAQKPEARVQIKDADASLTRARDEFDEWYVLYPHKVGRGQAEKAFIKARKIASLEDLCDGVRRYIASKPTDYQWRNPATWLNGKGWLDVPVTVEPANRSTAPPKPRNAGELARQQLKAMSEANDPSTETGYLDKGDEGPGFAGTGIARRIAIAVSR